MALLGQTKPEDILGMSQEEFKKRLESTVTKEDFAKQAEENQKTASSLDEIKAAIAALKPTPVAEPEVDPSGEVADLLNDPKTFIKNSTKDLQASQLQTQADLQEMRARQDPNLAPYFAKHGEELVQKASGMSLAQRAHPNFWSFHVRTVMGDKLIKGEVKGGAYPSLIGTSSFGPSSTESTNPADGMAPDMVEYFKKRNIPLESAAKIMKLQADGEPISIATVKGVANA